MPQRRRTFSSTVLTQFTRPFRQPQRTLFHWLGLMMVCALLLDPFRVLSSLGLDAPNGVVARTANGPAVPLTVTPAASPTATVSVTPPATPQGTPSASVTIPPPILPSGTPTAAPTATPPPDTDVVDQALDVARAGLLTQVQALPTVTDTLVSGATGGRLTSADGRLTLGLLPGSVGLTDTLAVQIQPRSFPTGDPRATRNGQPLAFTFELTATHGLGGPRVTSFAKDAVLVWQIELGCIGGFWRNRLPPARLHLQ